MQIVRTIIWVLILVGVVLFSFFNWREVEVTIWDNLVLETKVPALVIISFLLGFLPTWLYARGVIWSLNRKIRSLEIAAKANSVSAAARESDRDASVRKDAPEAQPEPETPVAAGQTAKPGAEPEPEAASASDDRLTPDDGTNTSLSETPATAPADEAGEDGAQEKSATT
mgnify:CR=1 FL=1